MNMSYHRTGQIPFNATTTVNTAAMLAVNTSGNLVAGTGYKVGDILNATQGTGGKIRVTSINPATGGVTGIELFTVVDKMLLLIVL
jgi:hypothetical protein